MASQSPRSRSSRSTVSRNAPTLAQQSLHRLAERSFTSSTRELPLCNVANFDCRVVRRSGDSRAQHRREIGKIVAEVEDLIEAEIELAHQALARIELVRGSLLQLLDSELARPARQGGGAAAGQKRDADADFLQELYREPVADVEGLDLARFAGVDDLAVCPDAVDVGDDEANVQCARGHARAC